jgi:LysM repeat protein
MDQNQPSDAQEMFDDMSNDVIGPEKSQANRPAFSRFTGPSSGTKIILWVDILLVIILVALYFRGSNSASREDLNALRTKLDQMEKRLASMDMTEKKLASLENQVHGLQQSMSRFDSTDKSLRDKIDKLTQQMEKPAPPPVPAPSKSEASPSSQKASLSKGAARYHEVRPGETLYHIASKYGMTVDELRRLNNLKPNQAIRPGQKLAVTPNRP